MAAADAGRWGARGGLGGRGAVHQQPARCTRRSPRATLKPRGHLGTGYATSIRSLRRRRDRRQGSRQRGERTAGRCATPRSRWDCQTGRPAQVCTAGALSNALTVVIVGVLSGQVGAAPGAALVAGPGRWRVRSSRCGVGEHRPGVLVVVAGVLALIAGGVVGQQDRVGVGQRRLGVLAAPARVSRPWRAFHRPQMPLAPRGAAGAEPPARRKRRRASPPQWRMTVTGPRGVRLAALLTAEKVRATGHMAAEAANSRAAQR